MKITKVKILKKPLTAKDKKNMCSLYLDFYPPLINPQTNKETRREFLNLQIFGNPQTKEEREHNKSYMQLASKVKAKRELDIHAQRFDFLVKDKIDNDFLDYFKTVIDAIVGVSAKTISESAYKQLSKFCNGKLNYSQINAAFLNDFKKYLLNGSIKQNTAAIYFFKVKNVVKGLVKTKSIDIDLLDIDNIKTSETFRQYLTLDELKRLIDTDCKRPELKRAAIFSALTGLRFSDIQKLTWLEIQTNNNGHEIVFRQKKTKQIENLPINDNAISLLGMRGKDTDKVFQKIAISSYNNLIIKLWVNTANISKHITFHCFRHTYATLLLNNGIDLYTVSKMLGHRDIKTTQIYAKISDNTKRNAADAIQVNVDKINKKF